MASPTKKTWNIRYRKYKMAGRKRKNQTNTRGTTKSRIDLFKLHSQEA
jgi:hypothetical protein